MMCDEAVVNTDVSKEIGDVGTGETIAMVNSNDSSCVAVTSSSEQCISSVEKTKDPDTGDRRRSKSGKRRSGFSRGRISLTQLSKDGPGADSDSSGGQLHKQIPVEMAPDQRLALYSRLALRHTLELLVNEFEETPGFDDFKADALDGVGDMIDQMAADGTFKQACTTPSLAPNPVNLQMSATISELRSSICRLQKEESCWDELVSRLETQAKQAEQQLTQQDMPYDTIPLDVRELSASFMPPSLMTPHLSDTASDAVTAVKTVSLLMDDYCDSVELLDLARCAAQKDLGRLSHTLEHESSSRCQDPKEQIQQLFANGICRDVRVNALD